jgi:general secretion pathway protein F
MLQAGQDLDRALLFLVETSEDKRARNILRALRDEVRGGRSLAAGLSEHPAVFSTLYISLVRAGEAGGNLAESLSHLADMLEREESLAGNVQSALVYPAFLVIASIGAVVFLLTYVLPEFAPIFAQAGAQLPFVTRLMMSTGDFLRDDGMLILVFSLAGFLISYRLLQEPNARLVVERALLRLPIVGLLIERSQAARLTRTLGTLLQNGVALVTALNISRDVLASRIAAKIVDAAILKVKAGDRVAAALSVEPFFPLQTIHLLRLGEETGRLGEMALRVASIHDEQVYQTVQRLVALMVPIITVLMGLLVAGIVGSLLVAMMSLNDLAA